VPDVVIVDVGTGEPRSFETDINFVRGLDWITGAQLVINQSIDAPGPGQLLRMPTASGALTRITNDLLTYDGVNAALGGDLLVTTREDARSVLSIGDAAFARGADVLTSRFPGPRLTWLAGDLVVQSNEPDGVGLMRMGVDGARRGLIVPDAVRPTGSPDGRYLFFTAPGLSGLRRVDADGRNRTELITGNDAPAEVTPDSRLVLFLSSRRGTQTAWMVPVDGGPATELANVGAGADSLSISPDGRQLVARSRGTRGEVVMTVCDFPACNIRREFPSPGAGRVRWTPDGSGIAFVEGGTPRNIFVQPVDGGPPRQLTNFLDSSITDFAWSPDGQRLAVAREALSRDIVLFKRVKP
jgi:dipeptidyl aminopeptidase/acylaminoacyl peptidase